MSDLILSVEDAAVQIGGKPFFKDLTFHIHARRKIALVGKNGAGKTTLMNIITGKREIDDGKRFLLPNITTGYMQQHIEPTPEKTVYQFIFEGISETLEDWDRDYRIEMVITPLHLHLEDKLENLSGGQLRRVALARALVEQPDILLLDEPTNHMDLELIEWLENYLHGYKGAVVCVSHDRAFLANITDRVFWLDRGSLRVSPRGFAYFEEWSKEMLAQEGRELQNRAKKVEMEMEWAQRGVKARIKRNVRRQALAFEARDQLERDIKSFRRVTSKIELPPVAAEESANSLIEFHQVCKTFTNPETGRERKILDKFNMRVRKKDRVGILGRNGSGKTTFLRLLLGEQQANSGKIKRANDIQIAYFDQNRSMLKSDKTLKDNLCQEGSDYLDVRGKMRHVCGYLKDFMFDPEDAWRAVSTLSGGQKNRLMLAKVLANPGSMLILDEPTNDLDMDTLDMLRDILISYDGTLFIVSHDRDFMDRVVTTTLAFEGDGKVEGIVGGYTDYLAFKKAQEAENIKEQPHHRPAAKANISKKENSGAEFLTTNDKKNDKKLSYKLQLELEQLPAKIARLEAEINALSDAMADPSLYMTNSSEFDRIAKRMPKAQKELEIAESRWIELEELQSAL